MIVAISASTLGRGRRVLPRASVAAPSGRLADVLVPAWFGGEQADGWGDFRMRCGATQIAFSAEDPGWQVVVDGPMPGTDRKRLVTTIAQQIGQATSPPCGWLQIT